MPKCPICHSKKVNACNARRLNALFSTTDFTDSTHGKLSSGFVRAIFPLAHSLVSHVEQLLRIHFYKPAMVVTISSSDNAVILCRDCGTWHKG